MKINALAIANHARPITAKNAHVNPVLAVIATAKGT